MKILTKKIFREMRFNKFRSAIIILTIFTAISLGIGLVNMVGSVDVSVIANDEKLNNADLRTRLTEYISEDEVSSLLTESEKTAAGIIDLEGRIFEYASVVYQEKIYDAYLIGVDLEKNTINKLQLRSGTFPRVTNQVMVEQHFGSDLLYSTGAAVNDPLTISFRNATLDVTIAGFVADSEYLYVIDEQTEILSLGQLCVVYLPLDMLHEKFQLSGINEILVRTTERSQNAYQKADQVLSNAIGENRIQSVIYWDKTAEKKMLYQRMNAVENLGIAFGLFSLVAGSIAIYNSLSKLVMSQRIHIGLYGALGARPWGVLSHYVGFGTILGIIGVITGWLGATLITYGLLELGIKPLCGLVITKVAFVPGIWIVGTLLTVIVVFVFSLLSTLPVLRLTPHEAMKAPYSTSELGNEPLLERIMRPLGIFNRLVSKIPLRTVFMNKKRSLATAFAVAASMVILVASVSLVYDYTLGIERNYSDYEKYDVQVILQHPTSEQLIETWIQQHATGIRTVEGFIYTNVWIGSQRIPLQAFHQNSILRNYHVIEGTAELTKDTLLVGSVLAKELRVNLGDQLTLVFDPDVSLSVEVAGITGELLDYSLLWTIEGIQQRTTDIQGIGISENVTSFVFEYDEDLSQDEETQLKQLIQERYQPYAYTDTNDTIKMIEGLMETFVAILLFIAILGLATLVLFTFSSMSLAIMGREIEFLALRAMGSKTRTILQIIFLENLLFGIFGFLLGVPISFAILRPMYRFIFPNIYLPVVVPVEVWVVVVVLILFCVFLATSLLAWNLRRRSLPDMLYTRMIT